VTTNPALVAKERGDVDFKGADRGGLQNHVKERRHRLEI